MSDIAPEMWEKLPPADPAAVTTAPSLTYWQDARRRLFRSQSRRHRSHQLHRSRRVLRPA